MKGMGVKDEISYCFAGEQILSTDLSTDLSIDLSIGEVDIMIIHEATIEDYKGIYRLNKDGFGYDYPIEKTKDKLKIILGLPTDKIFIAEVDGEKVGYIHLSSYECTYSDSLKNILALVVDESYRKMGIGRKLIETAEEWAKGLGAKGIRLVSGYNRTTAHQFYLSYGYVLRKEQKNFIKWFQDFNL